MSHLTEEQLNLYLDNELSTAERAAVESHLAGCQTCRMELVSLQALFTALNALQPEVLTADLSPIVLEEIAAERQRTVRRRRMGWLVPALQTAAAILLLVFCWSALVTRYSELSQRILAETLHATWTAALARGGALWTAAVAQWQAWWVEAVTGVLDLPSVLAQVVGGWPRLPGLGLTVPQAIAVSSASVLMWLVGNSLLLRVPAMRLNPSRQPNHH